ncbi:MAG TPA: ribosome maturation factor RimM [Acidimicrobiia bacterium]
MDAQDDARISVGYVRRAHGLGGEVLVRELTDHPGRYRPGAVFLTDEQPPRRLVVAGARSHSDGLIVHFVGVDDRDLAEAIQGAALTISVSERRSLGAGEFWPDDLEGLAAIDPDGTHLGVVTGVVLGAAQDRLVVATLDGREVEVPFVEEIVGEIHPSLGHVVIDPPEGLF